MTSAWGTNHCCSRFQSKSLNRPATCPEQPRLAWEYALWTCCMLRQRSNSLRTPSIASTSSDENSRGWAQGQIRPAKSGIHRASRTLRGGNGSRMRRRCRRSSRSIVRLRLRSAAASAAEGIGRERQPVILLLCRWRAFSPLQYPKRVSRANSTRRVRSGSSVRFVS
jgi:hypothetical protein